MRRMETDVYHRTRPPLNPPTYEVLPSAKADTRWILASQSLNESKPCNSNAYIHCFPFGHEKTKFSQTPLQLP